MDTIKFEITPIGEEGYILIVREFIQQFEQSTPGITSRMRKFFEDIKPLTSLHQATYGNARKFLDINFNEETFSNANKFSTSPTIIAFQREFSLLAYEFLLKVSPRLRTSCLALSKNLAALDGKYPKRTAIFVVHYKLDSPQFNNDGIATHVDREASLGALTLGGTPIPDQKPTLRIYDTCDYEAINENPNDPKFKWVDVSYSEGDFVLAYGTYAHKSFIAVNGRIMYTQFLKKKFNV